VLKVRVSAVDAAAALLSSLPVPAAWSSRQIRPLIRVSLISHASISSRDGIYQAPDSKRASFVLPHSSGAKALSGLRQTRRCLSKLLVLA
jgi:hypothetical protein